MNHELVQIIQPSRIFIVRFDGLLLFRKWVEALFRHVNVLINSTHLSLYGSSAIVVADDDGDSGEFERR